MRKDPCRGPHQQGSGSRDLSLPPTAFSAALPTSPAAWGSGTERSPSAQTTCSGPAFPSLCKMQLNGVIRTMRHGNKSTQNTSPNFTLHSKAGALLCQVLHPPECFTFTSMSPPRQCRGHGCTPVSSASQPVPGEDAAGRASLSSLPTTSGQLVS